MFACGIGQKSVSSGDGISFKADPLESGLPSGIGETFAGIGIAQKNGIIQVKSDP